MKSVILIILVYVCSVLVFQLGRYGTRYNEKRIGLGIPVISKEWDRDYSLLGSEINYTNPVPDKEKRYHLKKRIQTDWLMNIEKESDYFIIEDKDMAIDARYDYKNPNHWYIWYYHKGESLNRVLSHSQFIDTLKKYKIDIKH